MKQKQRRSTFLLRRKKYFAKAIGIIEEPYVMFEGRCLFDSDSVDYDEYSYESNDSQGDGSAKSSNRTTQEKPTKGFFRRFFSGKKAWFKWNLGVVVATFGA